MSYKCVCGGPLVPCRVGISKEDGSLMGTVCFKQWCPNCGNSRLNDKGEVMYYQIKGGEEFEFDTMKFWAPETVPFKAKRSFIETVLKMADEGRFEGKQYFTMEQIRKVFKEEQEKKDFSTYGGI